MQTLSATIDRSFTQCVHPPGRFGDPLRRGACLERAKGESLQMREVSEERQFTNRSLCEASDSQVSAADQRQIVIVGAEGKRGLGERKQRSCTRG
jgi:hypothetical protein